jgi:hypothetical protein
LPSLASAQAPAYVTQWGTYGTGNGQFANPEDLAVDASGNVYVTDRVNNRIQVFGPGLVDAESTTCCTGPALLAIRVLALESLRACAGERVLDRPRDLSGAGTDRARAHGARTSVLVPPSATMNP